MKKNKILILALLLFCNFACQDDEFDIINLNGNSISVFGHGGMGRRNSYPTNSFESITYCLNLGADGTELDVQMTKDSVLVAFHDRELSDVTNGKGVINDMSWSEFKSTQYSYLPYLDYSVISLEELFSNTKNIHRYKFTFDCKLHTNNTDLNQFYRSYINALETIIQKYQLENDVYIESESTAFIGMLKIKHPNYRLFYYSYTFEAALDVAFRLNLSGITMSTHYITKEQIKMAHDRNLLVVLWSIYSNHDNIDAILKNPDFIQTDKLKDLLGHLK